MFNAIVVCLSEYPRDVINLHCALQNRVLTVVLTAHPQFAPTAFPCSAETFIAVFLKHFFSLFVRVRNAANHRNKDFSKIQSTFCFAAVLLPRFYTSCTC